MNYSYSITCDTCGRQEDCEFFYQIPDIDIYIAEDTSHNLNEEKKYRISFSPKEMDIEKFMGFLNENKEWFAKLTNKNIDIYCFHDGLFILDYPPEFLLLLGEMDINLLISGEKRKPIE